MESKHFPFLVVFVLTVIFSSILLSDPTIQGKAVNSQFDAQLNKAQYKIGERVHITLVPSTASYSASIIDPQGTVVPLTELTYLPTDQGEYSLNILLYTPEANERFVIPFTVGQSSEMPTFPLQPPQELQQPPPLQPPPESAPLVEEQEQSPLIEKIKNLLDRQEKQPIPQKAAPQAIGIQRSNSETNPEKFYVKDARGEYQKYLFTEQNQEYRVTVRRENGDSTYLIDEQGMQLKEEGTVLVDSARFTPQRFTDHWENISFINSTKKYAQTEDNTTITVTHECADAACTFTEIYDIGFDGHRYSQKITVQLESSLIGWEEELHRVVWNINGIGSGQDLQFSNAQQKQYGKVQVDFSDYAGATLLQEYGTEEKISIIFEPEGEKGNFIIDPQLTTTTSSTQVTIVSQNYNPTWNITMTGGTGGVITNLHMPFNNELNTVGSLAGAAGLDNFRAATNVFGSECWVSQAQDTAALFTIEETTSFRIRVGGNATIAGTQRLYFGLDCLAGVGTYGNASWTTTCFPDRCVQNKTIVPLATYSNVVHAIAPNYAKSSAGIGSNVTLFDADSIFTDTQLDPGSNIAEFTRSLPSGFNKYHGWYVQKNQTEQVIAHMVLNTSFVDVDERWEVDDTTSGADFLIGTVENTTDHDAFVKYNVTFVILFDNSSLHSNITHRMQKTYEYLSTPDSLEMLNGTVNTTKGLNTGIGYDLSTTCYTIDMVNNVTRFNHSGSASHNVTFPCYEIGSYRIDAVPNVTIINASGLTTPTEGTDYEIEFKNNDVTTDTLIFYVVGTKDEETQYTIAENPDIFDPVMVYIPPTPENGSTVTTNHFTINTTITDYSNTSAWIDFNRTSSGYWAMDFSNTTHVYDNSTYGYHGTFTGTGFNQSNKTAGKYGQALAFDGNNDYLTMGDVLDKDGASPFSIAAWIKKRPATATEQIAAKALSASPFTGYQFRVVDTHVISFNLANSSSNRIRVDGSTTVDDNSWHYVAMTYTGSKAAGGVRLYVDGKNESVTVPNNGLTLSTTTPGVSFNIGGRADGNDLFNGSIDEVHFWDRALSPEEINATFNNGAYRLYHNFTDLGQTTHNFTACAIDVVGNYNCTETRFVVVDTVTIFCGSITANTVLNNNVTNTSTCYTINADNIVLDCAGYTITAPTGSNGTAINVQNHNNVTIKGCNILAGQGTIRGIGINASGITNSYLLNNSILTFGDDEDWGIVLNGSSSNFIFNNTIKTNGTGNLVYGIFLQASSLNNISTNSIYTRANGSNNYGVFINNDSSQNNVTDNYIMTNGTNTNHGIYLLTRINATRIENNTIYTNGRSGGNNYGINGDTNIRFTIVLNNTIYTNGSGNSNYGIQFISTVSNNTVTNNRIYTDGTGTTNYGVIVTADASQNNVTDNYILTNGTSQNYGVNLITRVNRTRVENNTIFTNGRTGGTNTGIAGSTNIYFTTIVNNTIFTNGSGSSNYGIQFGSVAENNTITNNRIYTQGTGSTNRGVYLISAIANNNITDNYILTNGTFQNYGIDLNIGVNTTRIENNTIYTNGRTGGSVYGVVGSTRIYTTTMVNNTLFTNGSGNFNVGIRFSATIANNTFTNNRIYTDGIGTGNDGIELFTDASQNNVTDNYIFTNGTNSNIGIWVLSSINRTRIENNTVYTNGRTGGGNIGINSVTRAHYTTIVNNTIYTNGSGNSNLGVQISGIAFNNTVINNRIYTDGTGTTNYGVIVTADASQNNVTDNYIFTNGTSENYGVYVFRRVNRTIVENNSIYANGRANGSNFGIILDGVSISTILSRNFIHTTGDSDSHGIALINATAVTINHQVIETNTSAYGIVLNFTTLSQFNHTLLNNTQNWIWSNLSVLNVNFTNTTFWTPNGSIQFNNNFTINARRVISRENLNITSNRTFLNTTNLTFMNTSAIIALNLSGFSLFDPRAMADSSDSGVFSACAGDVCTEQSYINNLFTFNISHWTAYAAAESTDAPPIVQNITPTANTKFNQSTIINISANVVDGANIDMVLANITFPNGTQTKFRLFNVTAANFTGLFNITNQLGRYNLTIEANDTNGNLNNTETSYFNVTACGYAGEGNYDVTANVTCELADFTVNGNITIKNPAFLNMSNLTVRIRGNSSVDDGATWNITGTGGHTIWMNGNLTVDGIFSLLNETLRMNGTSDGEVGIEVLNGGGMRIINSSNVTNGETVAAEFAFQVFSGATFIMTDSFLSECGWVAENGRYGLALHATPNEIRNNTFTSNFASLLINANDVVIADNTFNNAAGGTISAILYFANTTGTDIRDNLAHITAIAEGIRIFGTVNHTKIRNNRFNTTNEMMNNAVFGAGIMENITIMNNTFNSSNGGNTAFDLANIEDSLISNNTISAAGGIIDFTATNVTINNNSLNGNFFAFAVPAFGIDIDGNYNAIRNNRLTYEGGIIIQDNAQNNSIINNTIWYDNQTGIRIDGNNTNVTNNTFQTIGGGFLDLNLSAVSGGNTVWLNHLFSTGIIDSGTSNNFCVASEGNFYNESIGPGRIVLDNGDCGLANITDTMDGKIFNNTIQINWSKQSAHTNLTYDLFLRNSTHDALLTTTAALTYSWDTSTVQNDNYSIYIVPNITEFGVRVNATTNLTQNFSIVGDPCRCLLDNGGLETGTCIVRNAICTSNVNITVDDSAELSLINTTLIMNGSADGNLGIRGLSFSTINITQNSNVTDIGNSYKFLIEETVAIRIDNSIIQGVGWSNEIEKRGIELNSRPILFQNNLITNGYYGLVLYTPNNTIFNSTINSTILDGVFVYNSLNTTFNQLTFDRIAKDAIKLQSSHNTKIFNNTVLNSGGAVLMNITNLTHIDQNSFLNISNLSTIETMGETTSINITNNTFAQSSNLFTVSSLILISPSSSNYRVIGNSIRDMDITQASGFINSLPANGIFADNKVFNITYSVSAFGISLLDGANVTNNSFRLVSGADIISTSGHDIRIFNNSFLNNTMPGGAIISVGSSNNRTIVENNTLINTSGVGILIAGAGNTSIRYNLIRGNSDTGGGTPIHFGSSNSNITIFQNTIFENRNIFDVSGGSNSNNISIFLNHFFSKGIQNTFNETNSDFCNTNQGNFYNESILSSAIGFNDCGPANITNTMDRKNFTANVTVNWTNQSTFFEILTYNVHADNGTLLGLTAGSNFTFNTTVFHDGSHYLYLVPNLTDFTIRINATVNRTENFTTNNHPPQCLNVTNWGQDTDGSPYLSNNRTPEFFCDLDEQADCRFSATDEAYADMLDNINCIGDDTNITDCLQLTDLPVGINTFYLACNNTIGLADSVDTNQEYIITILPIATCDLRVGFTGADFGLMYDNTTNDTQDDHPLPIIIENNGTVLINITLNATDLWDDQPNPSAFFRYQIEDNETSSYASAEDTAWVQLQSNRALSTTAITRLRYINKTNANNSAEIELNISAPYLEPAGDKQSIIQIMCIQDE